MGGESLTAAVRSGDVKAVKALLDAGGDPDVVDERGTPALCLAVDGFDLATVEVLMPSARLDRVVDGQTPLLRAVDRGASDIVTALINHGAQLWHKDREGRDALALARSWHETGAVAELRRRSGSAGTVRRETVRDENGVSVEELTLAGLTVRTGHSAILTALEPRYGIRTSFTELLSRALAEPDVDHEIWWVTTNVLQERRDRATWDMAAALRDRPDPRERYFGAEVLRLFNLFDYSDEAPFDAPLVDLFLPWAAREPDPRVLRPLTAGLSGALDPRAERPLHDLARHADSGVREWAVFGLQYGVDAGRRDALATVLACTRDEAAESAGGPAPHWSPRPRVPRSRTPSRRVSPTSRRTYGSPRPCSWPCATIRVGTRSWPLSTPVTMRGRTSGSSTTWGGTAGKRTRPRRADPRGRGWVGAVPVRRARRRRIRRGPGKGAAARSERKRRACDVPARPLPCVCECRSWGVGLRAAYDPFVVVFQLERVSPSPVEESWLRLTDWHRHAAVVPLTRVTVRTPPPTGEGTVFVARSGVGPLVFDDPMEVVTWRPPRDGGAGRCRLVKRGTFVTGWAEIEVRPVAGGGSRVLWREDLNVRWLPRFFDRPLGWAGRWMFGRAVGGLLRPES
ncbi:Ankyrin repeat-containing protein [Streptomyces sp. OV198]|nr:Ankyrin repeat-containing protein [Streptomyces sp. OV198]